MNVLHEEFFESEIKQIHLYICGTGNVGSKLIQQIYDQNAYLQENFSINLRIAGISNSRNMLFSDQGISYENYLSWNDQSTKASVQDFAGEIISRNLETPYLLTSQQAPKSRRSIKVYWKEASIS